MSVYETRIWKLGRALLPQPIRLKLRIPIIRLVAVYKQVVQKSYSANGEDLLIRSLIRGSQDVWYMDIDAGDPRIHSNTYALYLDGARGVVVDANRALLAEFSRVRPGDRTIWGAITMNRLGSDSVTYWTLDPWELSTTDPGALERALRSGARLVSEDQVPAVDVNELLRAIYPADVAVKLLNVDIEGISFEVLNNIDFAQFSFDYVLVERDSPNETFDHAEGGSLTNRYVRVGSLGPTDAYSRARAGATH